MKRLRNVIAQKWHLPLLCTAIAAVLSVPLWWQLVSLTSGLSASESQLLQQVGNGQIGILGILRDPFFLPYKLALYGIQALPWQTEILLRGISALFGAIGVLALYYIVRTWYSQRLALIAAALLVTSAWYLHIARYASFDSVYALLIATVAAWVWLKQGGGMVAFVLALLLSLFTLYIPGGLWLLLILAFWQRKSIMAALTAMPLPVLMGAIMTSVVCSMPLVLAFVMPSEHSTALGNLRDFLGLPDVFPSLRTIAGNLAAIPLQLFVVTPAHSLLSVGRAPLLDLFTSASVLIGLWGVLTTLRRDRSKILLSMLVIGSLLIALNGPVHLSLLIGILYLLAAIGIARLLDEWMGVFPRNPVARTVGAGMVIVAVTVACTYQLISYFVAWPHTDTAKATFGLQQKR